MWDMVLQAGMIGTPGGVDGNPCQICLAGKGNFDGES